MMSHTTPKGIPQTPPASTRKGHGAKPVPKFQLPDSTPESHSRTGHVQLQTPATTRKKPFSLTPHAGLGPEQGTTLFPPSPDFTPQRSPRSKRKKLNFENILPSTDSFSILLPNHGYVGSGRKHMDAFAGLRKPHEPLDSAELFRLNKNLEFEQDVLESPTKRGRPRKSVPLTPGKQLITEEKVRSWHGRSFGGHFSSDDEVSDTESSGSKTLANPFLDSQNTGQGASATAWGSKKTNPFIASGPKIDYATHMELINHRTGERRIESLSEEQQKFKPKKLNFTGI